MDVDVRLPRETGRRVRDVRKRRKLSRRRVAADAGFAARELASIERGRRALSVHDLRSLAGSIGVEVTALLPDGTVLDDTPPADEMRIEDLLEQSVASSDLEAGSEHDPYRGMDPVFVERRKVPIASARLTRTFAELRAHTERVTEYCALLQGADAADDVPALLAQLQRSLAALEEDTVFAECLARHEEAREEYLRAARESNEQSWQMRAGPPATDNELT